MKTDDYIDEYIRQQKAAKPCPFLSTRIMAQLEPVQQRPKQVWQTIAIAASFLLVVAMGIGVGTLYSGTTNQTTALNINDNQIENRIFLNTLAYE
jgi:hypothetical protein